MVPRNHRNNFCGPESSRPKSPDQGMMESSIRMGGRDMVYFDLLRFHDDIIWPIDHFQPIPCHSYDVMHVTLHPFRNDPQRVIFLFIVPQPRIKS